MNQAQQQQNILAQIKQFVTNAMSENDPAHDGNHVHRVVHLTMQLCDAYPQANRFRAELIAWLHDMQDDKLKSNTSETSLAAYLCSLGTSQEDIRFVLSALPYISYRKYPKLSQDVPLEIRIVQDADRIDAMGAIGIARTFAYGGSRGRALEESLAHFDEKLLLLYDLLNTQDAKRIAKPRWELLKLFYANYITESQI